MDLLQQIGDAAPLGDRLLEPALPRIAPKLLDAAAPRALRLTMVSGDPNLICCPSERRPTSRWCPMPDGETIRLPLTR
jgi:hypothetical protein